MAVDAPAPRLTAATRVLAVLGAFDPQHRRLSLSEIARRANLTLPTAHRLVRELTRWGGLERDENGLYSVGLRLLELAALSPRWLHLREAAFPYIDDLHEVTRGNVQLGVRDGLEVIYVEALRAREQNAIDNRVGGRWPMHATGTGLVLLAHADRELQARALQPPLRRFTSLTVTDPAEVRRHLARIRRTGVAIARGQITPHDLVVAVPVLDPAGEVTAALSVVVETERARPRELAKLLTEASRAVSARLARLPASVPAPR